jgi:hypothetical protein
MRYLSILILSLFLSNLQAQMPIPVKWSQETEQVSDTEYDLIFTATIDEGWNIYSQFVEEGGPIPTGLFFEEGPHFELVGKAKEEGKFKEGMDPVFEINVKKFLNKATFTQRIKVNDSSVPINVEVEYMACRCD